MSWGICLGCVAGKGILWSVSTGQLVEDVYRQSVDLYKQLSSPFPQQLYKSTVQVCATPYAINYSPDWKLLSILKSTNVRKPGVLESRCTLQTLEKAFVLPFWMVDQ